MTPAGILICPLCAAPLAEGDAALRCPAGHSFDRSRDGYVNLLLARGRRAASRGDSAAMLRARRAFLEAGYYLPLLEALAEMGQSAVGNRQSGSAVQSPSAGRQPGPSLLGIDPVEQGGSASTADYRLPTALLDAGCGEGWYLGTLGARLAAAGRRSHLIGTDISRDAARMTARRYPEVLALVADTTRRLPIAGRTVNLLLNVFAPRNPAEFARVLTPDGVLLTVIPAPDHLPELRAAAPLLAIEPDKEAEVIARMCGPLRPAGRRPLAFSMRLPADAVQALVAMSPSAYHLTAAERTAVERLPAMTVTASFILLRFVPG